MKTLIRICNTIQFVCLAVVMVWGFNRVSGGRDLEPLFALIITLPFLPSTCIAAVAFWAAVTDSRRALCISSAILLFVVFFGSFLFSAFFGTSVLWLVSLWWLQAITPLLTLYGVLLWPEQAGTVKSIARKVHAWRWPISGVMVIVVAVVAFIAAWRYTEGFTLIRWNDSGEALSKNPARLSSAALRDKSLQGLHLANVTITKAIFKNVDFGDARFENVTFDNCVFIDCDTANADFRNVTFKGGRFAVSQDKEHWHPDALILESKIPGTALTFDNVTLGLSLDLRAPDGGRYLFRDCRADGSDLVDLKKKGISQPLRLYGEGARVSLQGCDFRDAQIHLGKKSALYAEKTNLHNVVVSAGTFYMERCTVAASIMRGTGVIRDSIAQLYVDVGLGGVYLVDNTYKYLVDNTDKDRLYDPKSIRAHAAQEGRIEVWVENSSENAAYIVGKGSDPVRLGLANGICVVEGMDLQAPLLLLMDDNYFQGSLRLHNSTLRGGVWGEPILRHSILHTVALYPTMKVLPSTRTRTPVDDGQLLSVFAVSEPEGSPWEGKAPQTRPGKAEWTAIRVPTLEELGMADLRR